MTLVDPPASSAAIELHLDELRAASGLDLLGVAPVEVFHRTRSELRGRRAMGLHADMQFTYRNPDRSTDPGRILPGARSLVVAARSHARHLPERPLVGVGARVARYATGSHYGALADGLEVVAEHLRSLGGQARVVFDDNALVDREAARRAGLGTYGKNANLLAEGTGSWFVLGSVVTDLELLPTPTSPRDPCRGCRRCIDGCPTGAIVDEGVVDARRCLAWLVQARGLFPVRFRAALGDRVYGCDTCQEVCPENRSPGGADDDASDGWLDALALIAASDDELLARHGNWYLADRDPDLIRRNALVVVGNVADPADARARDTIASALVTGSELVRAHAVWAARRLGHDDLLPASDPSPLVRAELAAEVEVRA